MGEYASYSGRSIKIGTCEDMYYLRFDQVHLVKPEANSCDPVQYAKELRFRFPFPDEDNIEPGQFDNHDRSVAVHGATAPADLEHSIVQFVASYPSRGYNVCLPCPESAEAPTHGLTVHRNGFNGAVHLVQQRIWEGRLAAVAKCGGCSARYRLPTIEDAEPMITALRALGDRPERDGGTRWYLDIADRIEAGYGEVGQEAVARALAPRSTRSRAIDDLIDAATAAGMID